MPREELRSKETNSITKGPLKRRSGSTDMVSIRSYTKWGNLDWHERSAWT